MKKLILVVLVAITNSLYAQNCLDFQDTTLDFSTPKSQPNYSIPIYVNSGISFRAKYDDWDVLVEYPAGLAIDDHLSTGYTGSNGNSNFVGNIMFQGWAITEIDFSALGYSNSVVEFDVNWMDPSVNPFYVNGADANTLPTGVSYVITPLTFGSHVVITGPINTIELHGHEVAIDNLCTSEIIEDNNVCLDFQDTTLTIIIPLAQSNYGSPFYVNGGISFRAKYDPFDIISGFDGGVNIYDHASTGYTGSNGNSNFVGNILYQGWAFTEIDFSALGYSNSVVEFDVNYFDPSVNPFNVNGAGINTLPAGVSYVITPLTFGSHVAITGPINTIEIHGLEVAIDNLCVETVLSSFQEPTRVKTLNVYPNPASEYVNIEIDQKIDKIELINFNGQLIEPQLINNNTINLSNLPSGIYIMRVVSEDQVFTGKIIKE